MKVAASVAYLLLLVCATINATVTVLVLAKGAGDVFSWINLAGAIAFVLWASIALVSRTSHSSAIDRTIRPNSST